MKAAGRATLLEFKHPLKSELERWLILQDRLSETLQAVNVVVGVLETIQFKRHVSSPVTTEVSQVRGQLCFAAITYMRCFGTGRRKALQVEDVAKLTARDRATHETIRELRNQFFAHAVSDDEGREVYLYRPAEASRPSGFYSNNSVVLLSPSLVEMRHFQILVKKVLRYALAQEKEVGNKLAELFFGAKSSWKALKIDPLERRVNDA